VSNWVWNRFSSAQFRELQSFRGTLGNKARWGSNEDKQASARLMLANGMKQAEIARELGLNQSTISRWME
jgi:transposase-like protein